MLGKDYSIMSKLIDLSGKRFGKLTIIQRLGTHVATGGQKFPTWECLCDCGNKVIATGSCLRSGHTTSCGCKNLTEDLTGRRINKLVVMKRMPNTKKGVLWKCKCDCGKEVTLYAQSLRRGQKSCGCHDHAKHGGVRKGIQSKEYSAWAQAKQRCCNSSNKGYKNYGGRGIRMSEEWFHDFGAFLRDMGPAPSPNHSIERINVNGDYCKENCCWLLKELQPRNTRSTKLNMAIAEEIRQVYAQGNVSYSQLEQKYGVCKSSISQVIRYLIWIPKELV